MKHLLSLFLILCPLAVLAVEESVESDLAAGTRVDAAYGPRILARWDHPIRLVYDPDGAPPFFADTGHFVSVLKESMAVWEWVSGLRFELVGIDRDAVDDNGLPNARQDGLVRISWEPNETGVASLTSKSYGEFRSDLGIYTFDDGSIGLSRVPSMMQTDVQLRKALEGAFGFLAGLGRSDNPNSLLNDTVINYLRFPREDDIRAVQALYGPGRRGPFDPAVPLPEWQYDPPSDASPTVRRHLFLPLGDAAGPYLGLGDEVFGSITDDTAAGASVYLHSGKHGSLRNGSVIDLKTQMVLVDPLGYEHHRTAWELSCAASTVCDDVSVEVAPVAYLRTLPGQWRIYVVDVSDGSAEGRTLLTVPLTVKTRPTFDQAPEATVQAIAGPTPGTITFMIAATDAEGERIRVIWNAPEIPGYVSRIDSGGVAVHTVDFGLNGSHTMYVELRDDYIGNSDTIDTDRGFHTLLRLQVKLPLSDAADALEVYSSGRDPAELENSLPPSAPYEELARLSQGAASGGGMTFSGAPSLARFQLGAAASDGVPRTFFLEEDLIVAGSTILVAPGDVGMPAEIFVVMNSSLNGRTVWSRRAPGGRFVPWDGTAGGLAAAYTSDSLEAAAVSELYMGHLHFGEYRVYVGYRVVGSDEIHFSAEPLELSVL